MTSYGITQELAEEVDKVAERLEVQPGELIMFFVLDGYKRLSSGEIIFDASRYPYGSSTQQEEEDA